MFNYIYMYFTCVIFLHNPIPRLHLQSLCLIIALKILFTDWDPDIYKIVFSSCLRVRHFLELQFNLSHWLPLS